MDHEGIKRHFPILEFDPDPRAILEPSAGKLEAPIPERMVGCFFREVHEKLLAGGQLTPMGYVASEMGHNPVYRLEYQGKQVMTYMPGLGAPLAGGWLDEVIAGGVTKAMICGGCGALLPELVMGHPVVVTAAVRDEGTSYHYLAPSREVTSDGRGMAALEAALTARGVPYSLGKTWTTDGFYRETAAKRQLRVDEGCSVVEMEASAMIAVAQARKIALGYLLYAGDLVVPDGWDLRDWRNNKSVRELLFWLCVDAVCRL
ncbi:MAG TPA: nucleoside phosphorylase [Bellilinea sp.]|nr:nucleoside phosphorylase [Bellilinea sp.]